MTWDEYDRAIVALTAWREARGEGLAGIVAVMHVIRNRVVSGHGFYNEVCTKPWQFTSMTGKNDPELILWPQRGDKTFDMCLGVAEDVISGASADPTHGATFYFNAAVAHPTWAGKFKLVATIGHHQFMKP